MTIVQRRVFYGKIGTGGELIEHMKKGNEAMARFGMKFKARVLSDYQSGRTDRVVVEWEMDSIADLESGMNEAMSDSQAQAELGPWMQRLNELIHYAEAEHWTVH